MIERPSLVLSLALLVGCGSSPPPPASAPAPAPATTPGPALTEAQIPVGHFRSPDGMVGLVLDRTGTPKLKVDGQNDIVELTQKEDRHDGKLKGYSLEAPDGTKPIYITLGGGILYRRGRDEFSMGFDKKAEPLPAATIKGTYVAPPKAYAALVERLTAISVRTTTPAFKAEDSALPAKVGEAIDKATPTMAVHYVSRGATSYLPSLAVAPDSIHGIGYGGVAHNTDDKWDPAGKGLAKYGGKMAGFFTPNQSFNHTNVMKMNGYPAPLAEGTPGLVWEVDGTTATFVSFDGGRYRINLAGSDKEPSLEVGAGPKSQWPSAVQHPLLDIEIVSTLSRAGALPEKATADLEALDTKWNECTAKAWREGPQKALEAHKGPGPRFSEAEHKQAIAKVKDGCKKHVDDEEKIFLQLTEERLKVRQALLDKAKAKF